MTTAESFDPGVNADCEPDVSGCLWVFCAVGKGLQRILRAPIGCFCSDAVDSCIAVPFTDYLSHVLLLG